MRAMSPGAIEAINAQETDKIFLCLLTIVHETLAEPLRFVRDFQNLTSNSVEYIASHFEIELPEESPDGPGEAMLSVDNVDRVIVDTIREIGGPPQVTIQVVLADQPDTIELLVDSMTLRDAVWDRGFVRGRLRFEDVAVEPVAETITPSRFPALF